MALIDPEGMFLGDRMAKLSLKARLYWPYIYLLANGYGRFEISYQKIVSRAFATFPEIPTRADLDALIAEYVKAYLLFLYRTPMGQIWGQWDTSAKYLPRHKTALDERSPVPPADSLAQWKLMYVESKQHPSAAMASLCCDFAENELTPTPAPISENFGKFPRVVGVVGGVGVVVEKELEEGKQNPPTPLAGGLFGIPGSREAMPDALPDLGLQISEPPSPPGKKSRSEKRSIAQIERALGVSRLGWWSDWWQIYPCREDKRAAMDAFEKRVTSEEIWGKVRAGAMRYRQKADADPELRLKYGQGWLNGERWEDEGEIRAGPVVRQSQKGSMDGAVAVLMRNLEIEERINGRRDAKHTEFSEGDRHITTNKVLSSG